MPLHERPLEYASIDAALQQGNKAPQNRRLHLATFVLGRAFSSQIPRLKPGPRGTGMATLTEAGHQRRGQN